MTSHPANWTLDADRRDRDDLLDRIGRAGTPGVDETTFVIDPVAQIGHDRPIGGGTAGEVVLVAGTPSLCRVLSGFHRVLEAAPFLVVRQDQRLRPWRMVVQLDVFDMGPWAGTDSSHRVGALHDLAAVAARVRTRGGSVYVLPYADGRADTTRIPGIRVAPGMIPADTEGAPPSRLLRSLLEYQNQATSIDERARR